MKNFILGFITALIVVGLVYVAYPFIKGFFNGGGPVNPEMLKPGILDYGTLKITVSGDKGPIADVEVDLGTIGDKGPVGPFAFAKTNGKGIALFEKVPVGTYDIFWNSYFFPKEYNQPPKITVEVVKDQTTEKKIELTPKQ